MRPATPFDGEFGYLPGRGAAALSLVCHGPRRRAGSDGWRIVSYERGPDDDVDAVFSSRGRSVEVEVFCNQGEPTVSDLERNTLPDD